MVFGERHRVATPSEIDFAATARSKPIEVSARWVAVLAARNVAGFGSR
jgi:hypothetical protein